jgi:phenylacetic acid degradation operon negative regulatory protein
MSRKPRKSAPTAAGVDRPSPIAPLVAGFAARRPPRTGSLIVTIFGDAVMPRGGGLLLSGLIELLGQFGINESQIRTALSRLVAEGWFESRRVGRRSFYRLTESAERRLEEGTRRIYFGPRQDWDGGWTVVALATMAEARRERMREDLDWLGFGSLGPGVFLHPSPDRAALAALVDGLPPADRPLVVEGGPRADLSPEAAAALVAAGWNFAALATEYRRFCARFAPLGAALERRWSPEPLEALLARQILVQDYHRIVLRDPLLPPALHKDAWIGHEAYALARRIYRGVVGPSETWIDRHFSDLDGPLPKPGPAFSARFAEPI